MNKTFLFLLVVPSFSFAVDAEVEFFEKKVRPILVANCISCHGEQKQKGGLRLDSRAAALKGGDTGPAITPKVIEKSPLIEAVNYTGENKMPPKGKLTNEEISVLTQWVKTGAVWPESGNGTSGSQQVINLKELANHWSFQPTKPINLPQLNSSNPSPIDYFIQQKLRHAGIKSAGLADKRTLIRRITFDLTGLPPTATEIDEFLKDQSPQAWEKVVDRILASPRYGERYARHWLDLVRYAETLGHEFDFELFEPWRYRDYVIRALNADVPYDQFLKEHIAGDLLAQPRRAPDGMNESVQATAFWFLGEAKHSPVDIRQDQADRMDNEIDVFSKTFLGLTVSCARCHDHKFDAISTKDYYSLFGILSSSRHDRAYIDDPAQRQKLLAPLVKSTQEIERLARERTSSQMLELIRKQGIASLRDGLPELKRLTGLTAINDAQFLTASEAYRQEIKRHQTTLTNWEKEANPVRMNEGWTTTGESFSDSNPRLNFTDRRTILRVIEPSIARQSLSAKLTGTLRSETFTIDRDFMLYRLPGRDVRVNLIIDNFQLIQDPIYGSLRFGATGEDTRWHVQNVSRWKGHRAYVEILDDGNGEVSIRDVIRANLGSQPPLTPNKLIEECLTAKTANAFGESLATVAQNVLVEFQKNEKLNSNQIQFLNLLLSSSANSSTPTPEENKLLADFQAAEKAITPARRALAMTEGTGLNERVFIRGNHKTPGEEAPRRLLEAVDPTEFHQGSGRQELANLLVNGKHPLTARVFVNRIWKHHFGEGIVRTPDDFGHQGQRPTHPELLDWLANWFVENGWSIKKLHRLILLSETYRESSIGDTNADEKDPKNELFHKMPVRRLEAEAIRDTLLSISGRLDPTMGGPPVPVFLTPFMQGRGRPGGSGPLDGAGRRSIYLQVRRNFLNPFFLAFDYPVPFSTIGKRTSSNVPAQALAMLNNPLVNQQTELWAKKVSDSPGTTEERIYQMYVTALGRQPSPGELAEAKSFVESQLAEYGPGQTVKAWSDLAHVIVNLKEFIFVR